MPSSTLLIVEDEAVIALDLQAQLETLGYQVIDTCACGRTALTLAEKHRPDLILMDIGLQGDMNGITAARQIHERWRIPVIFITSNSDPSTAQFIKTAQPFGFVFKPFHERELRIIIESALYKHRAEQALRQSEARFRGIFEQAAVGICHSTLDGHLLQVNQTFCDIVGYTRDELLQTNFYDITHPDDLADELAHIERLKEGELETFVLDKHFLRKNGAVIWANLTVSLTRDAFGAPSYMIAILKDITEQRQAEEALRIKNWAIDSSITPIAMADMQGRLTYVNPAFLKLWGLSDASAVLGQPAIHFWQTPDQGRSVVDELHREGKWLGELVALKQDGTTFDVQVSASLVFDANKNPLCILASVVDITERKQMEEALRQSEDKFRSIVESSPTAMYFYHLEAGDRLVLVGANPSADRIIGISHKLLLGNTLEEAFPKLIETNIPQMYRAVARGEQSPHNFEISYLDARVQGSYSVHVFQTAPLTIAVEFIDITSRKKAEDQLRTSREQLRALAAHMEQVREEERVRIAREIHDVLAQDLTRLKIDLTWMNRRLTGPEAKAQRELMQEKVVSLLALTDTCISSVQKIATELRPVVLDSMGLAAAVEWQTEEFSKRTGIACEVSVPTTDASMGRNQSISLFRILQESLTNIARHSKATELKVSLRLADEEAGVGDSDAAAGKELILTIEDNGRGITPEETADYRSLGLLGMHERALLLGGKCEITGQPGEGTTVTVHMPLR